MDIACSVWRPGVTPGPRCSPADTGAGDLSVVWNGPLPEILTRTVVHGQQGHLDLGVIGGPHVITTDGPRGVFRERSPAPPDGSTGRFTRCPSRPPVAVIV